MCRQGDLEQGAFREPCLSSPASLPGLEQGPRAGMGTPAEANGWRLMPHVQEKRSLSTGVLLNPSVEASRAGPDRAGGVWATGEPVPVQGLGRGQGKTEAAPSGLRRCQETLLPAPELRERPQAGGAVAQQAAPLSGYRPP